MSDYIPPELIPNILARLPVDDVLRCTSVCKSWYELITCPSFTNLHLNLSNQEPRMIIKYLKKVNLDFEVDCCLHRDNQTIDEIAKLDPPVQKTYWGIVDSVNGLFCLYDSYKKITVVLWNPSLRKSLVLPESKVLSNSRLGFGFVAASNDYKILMLANAYNNVVSRPTIYRLSTGSWHDVKLEEYSLDFQVKFRQAHLNGVLHWYACNAEEVNPTFRNFICSFDLENEKFGTLMVPSCLCLRHDDDASFLVTYAFKESLYILDRL